MAFGFGIKKETKPSEPTPAKKPTTGVFGFGVKKEMTPAKKTKPITIKKSQDLYPDLSRTMTGLPKTTITGQPIKQKVTLSPEQKKNLKKQGLNITGGEEVTPVSWKDVLWEVPGAINTINEKFQNLPGIKQASQLTGKAVGGLAYAENYLIGATLHGLTGKGMTGKELAEEAYKTFEPVGQAGPTAALTGGAGRLGQVLGATQVVSGTPDVYYGIKEGDTERSIQGAINVGTGVLGLKGVKAKAKTETVKLLDNAVEGTKNKLDPNIEYKSTKKPLGVDPNGEPVLAKTTVDKNTGKVVIEYEKGLDKNSELKKQVLTNQHEKVLEVKNPIPETPETPRTVLHEEAKKYKTVDEFIKAQGKPVYHGTQGKFDTFGSKDPNESVAGKAGTFFSSNKTEAGGFGPNIKETYISPEAKVKELYVKGLSANDIGDALFKARREGFDGIRLKGVKILRGDRAQLERARLELPKAEADVNKLADKLFAGEITEDAYSNSKELKRLAEIQNEINPTHTVVFNSDVIKTKSQLEKIYNESRPKTVLQEQLDDFAVQQGKSKQEIAQKVQTEITRLKAENLQEAVKKIKETSAAKEKAPTLTAMVEHTVTPEKTVRVTTQRELVRPEPVAPKLKEIKPPVIEKPPKIQEPVIPKPNKIERASKVFQRMQQDHPELQGVADYTKITHRAEIDKGIALADTDPQEAYRVAMGATDAPMYEQAATNIALSERALQEGNNGLFAQLVRQRSLAQTERGQAIGLEKASVSDNSTTRYVKEIINQRLERLGTKTTTLRDKLLKKSSSKQAITQIKEETSKAQKMLKSKRMGIVDAQKLIDSLSC